MIAIEEKIINVSLNSCPVMHTPFIINRNVTVNIAVNTMKKVCKCSCFVLVAELPLVDFLDMIFLSNFEIKDIPKNLILGASKPTKTVGII